MKLIRHLAALVAFVAAAQPPGNLSDVFAIVRNEGRATTDESRKRMITILKDYVTGARNLEPEWSVLNEALGDPDAYARGQAGGILSTIVMSGSVPRPMALPPETLQLVIASLRAEDAKAREDALRTILFMAGGVPQHLEPSLLKMAEFDEAPSAQRMAMISLASLKTQSADTRGFWLRSLNPEEKMNLRSLVLSAFGVHPPNDPAIIRLIIAGLQDEDWYIRQNSITAVRAIGPPAREAESALLYIARIEANLRGNAEAALRAIRRQR